jgi:hypothetical protein
MIKWLMILRNRSKDYRVKMNNLASIMGSSKKVIKNWRDNFKIAKKLAERSSQNHKYGKIYITT